MSSEWTVAKWIRVAGFMLSIAAAVSCVSAQQRWDVAQSLDTVEGYEEFLRTRPNADLAQAAENRLAPLRAQRAFSAAQQDGGIAAFERFLAEHPGSKEAPLAQARIEQLDERRDWQDAVTRNDAASFESFLREHPESRDAGTARANLLRIHDLPAWQRAQTVDTVGAYQEFLSGDPQSSFAADAQARIAALTAAADWEWTRTKDTLPAYRLFLSKHPGSAFSGAARERVAGLVEQARIDEETAQRDAEDRRRKAEVRASDERDRVRDIVDSECDQIQAFTGTVGRAKKELMRKLDLDDAELEDFLHGAGSAWSTTNPALDVAGRVARAFGYFDKLLEGANDAFGGSIRERNAPPERLCLAVASELMRRDLNDEIVTAIDAYRKRAQADVKCFGDVIDSLAEHRSGNTRLHSCTHLD